jgi:hypothetical protein
MANPTFFIKQNDNTPRLDVALQDDKGRPVDLTGATTVFHMRNSADDTLKIDGGSTTILAATRGELRYSWTVANTNTAGNFEAEFQVTYPDTTIQTFPDDGYIDVIITDDVS